ncbi:hypothetical protein DSM106972_008480 [Dulcicalothrix desertica PCC 7102]|uniref:Filamentous haemagglutinin FhaB/tRNA nuclease CdiA-like TPS domain-containing protein n=1 Tax=Dulcicalothrix desertica PCC 7102 TaxID=232991 RepID=A0A433VRX1_9CYAN|nr:S-layer family protein [Dulcicalothrix desertica]RUT08795.1 hypothetical protein DSM106972_008480 [Dulcicalothrix desertica PCC 7102]TWH44188.1 filamentous hemagglutinin family protein [Dulcicalothrix desertica PCC 7102]
MIINYFRTFVISLITASTLVTNFVVESLAQINPDTTLPNNSSVRLEGNTSIIEAGTIQGGNLFHSFKEFNIENNNEAFFNNAANIQNIITRVTGQSASSINGVIKANGETNLFLINPNGIIFGENASLQIGGSFIGSTANAIQFGNLGAFSATNPKVPTLLTINPSALLFSQNQASSIESNSVAPSGNNLSKEFTALGLRVPDGKSLLLVGGDVNINNGGLYAFGGRVELGGLASSGTIALKKDGDNFSLSFSDGLNKSDVSLSNNAKVDVRAGNGGGIAINARDLVLTGISEVLAGIVSGGTDNSRAGNIDINAAGTVNIQNSDIVNYTLSNTKAQGGDVNIKTNTLRLEDGGRVIANTHGRGQGGNLKIDATSKVELSGLNTVNGLYISSLVVQSVTKEATGNAGSLTINTPELRVLNGAEISGSTDSAGRGGDLIVNANKIEVIGTSSDDYVNVSQISTQAESTAKGAAGNLIIKTDELLVQNGGEVSASTFGAGTGGNLKIDATSLVELSGQSTVDSRRSGLYVQQNILGATGSAGSMTINTPVLRVFDGALVSASTYGAGTGGDLTVDAGIIEVVGTSSTGYSSSITTQAFSTGAAGDLIIHTDKLLAQNGGFVSASTFSAGTGGNLKMDVTSLVELKGVNSFDSRFASGLFVIQSTEGARGNAGNLTLHTDRLLVQDEATIAARSLGTGTAGNLTISANSINLDKNAVFTADTRSNKTDITQATININSRELILRRASRITTNATGRDVIGGDININTSVFGALENSNITANSASARGGNINIKTQGLFRSLNSAITASGATSEQNGNVNIVTILDPSRGLVEIPINLVDPSGLILARCSPRNSSTPNSFTVTGRSGLPISPEDLLQDVNTIGSWIRSENSHRGKIEQPIQAQIDKTRNQIVEASGLKIDDRGQVYLVASTQNAQSQYLPSQSHFCHN